MLINYVTQCVGVSLQLCLVMACSDVRVVHQCNSCNFLTDSRKIKNTQQRTISTSHCISRNSWPGVPFLSAATRWATVIAATLLGWVTATTRIEEEFLEFRLSEQLGPRSFSSGASPRTDLGSDSRPGLGLDPGPDSGISSSLFDSRLMLSSLFASQFWIPEGANPDTESRGKA